MTAAARPLSTLLRIALATAVAVSWLIATGLPAEAFVTRSYVERPAPAEGSATVTLDSAKPLVVVVERTVPAPEEERIWVDTNLYFAGATVPAPEPTEPPPAGSGDEVSSQQTQEEPQPLNGKKPYRLTFRNAKPGEGPRELLRFGETIDPYALAWAGGVVAPNGRYLLQYRAVSRLGDGDPQRQEWQPFEFSLRAPPPAQELPLTAPDDAAEKRVRVAWRHNAAPDIASYTIERQLGEGEWKVAQSDVQPSDDGANAVVDTVPRYGTYRYRITALRPAGDGSGEMLGTTSEPSTAMELLPPDATPPPSDDDGEGDGTGDGDGGSSAPPPVSNNSSGGTSSDPGFGTTTEPFNPSVAAPEDFDDTYRGPLDFGVEPQSVTERVPVDIAKGGGAASDSTIEVLDRAIDQERVLPPVAGGLILVVSAAHVLRYLNE